MCKSQGCTVVQSSTTMLESWTPFTKLWQPPATQVCTASTALYSIQAVWWHRTAGSSAVPKGTSFMQAKEMRQHICCESLLACSASLSNSMNCPLVGQGLSLVPGNIVTSYSRLGRLTLAEKLSQASMRSMDFRSSQTRLVAVAVNAMIGTSGNCCFSTPSFL